jgi:hypothetical protein
MEVVFVAEGGFLLADAVGYYFVSLFGLLAVASQFTINNTTFIEINKL